MEHREKAAIPADKYPRKGWFRMVKALLRLFVKKPEFIFLGDEVRPGGIILSNHEGPKAPLSLELYGAAPLRLWGAHEMNKDLKTAYRYQTEIYYHQKQHWNLRLARLFCLIATPLTCLYYKGIHLIPSFGDARFRSTLSESLRTLNNGCSVVIFPEKSDNGYLRELTGFYPGAVMLFQYCRKKGLNPPVYIAYLQRDSRRYIFDAPTTVEKLLDSGLSRTELAEKLCSRCNELGRMTP